MKKSSKAPKATALKAYIRKLAPDVTFVREGENLAAKSPSGAFRLEDDSDIDQLDHVGDPEGFHLKEGGPKELFFKYVGTPAQRAQWERELDEEYAEEDRQEAAKHASHPAAVESHGQWWDNDWWENQTVKDAALGVGLLILVVVAFNHLTSPQQSA